MALMSKGLKRFYSVIQSFSRMGLISLKAVNCLECECLHLYLLLRRKSQSSQVVGYGSLKGDGVNGKWSKLLSKKNRS